MSGALHSGSLPDSTKKGPGRLLSKRVIARLSTVGADGYPHVVPIWFLYQDGEILLGTNRKTAKIRNIRRDDHVSVAIDVAKGGFKLKGIMISGRARVVGGKEAEELNRRIHLKYMGAKALKNAVVLAYLKTDDVTIKIRPEKFVSWDYTDDPLSRAGGLPLE